jgi:hypothetical protein
MPALLHHSPRRDLRWAKVAHRVTQRGRRGNRAAARNDPLALQCGIDQQLGEQPDGLSALLVAQRHQAWCKKLNLGSLTHRTYAVRVGRR